MALEHEKMYTSGAKNWTTDGGYCVLSLKKFAAVFEQWIGCNWHLYKKFAAPPVGSIANWQISECDFSQIMQMVIALGFAAHGRHIDGLYWNVACQSRLLASWSLTNFTLLGYVRSVSSPKKSTKTAKCWHLLVSTPKTNDLFDRLQCIIWQTGVYHSLSQFWQFWETLLLVMHCVQHYEFCF